MVLIGVKCKGFFISDLKIDLVPNPLASKNGTG